LLLIVIELRLFRRNLMLYSFSEFANGLLELPGGEGGLVVVPELLEELGVSDRQLPLGAQRVLVVQLVLEVPTQEVVCETLGVA
jgi:hypothetical protein